MLATNWLLGNGMFEINFVSFFMNLLEAIILSSNTETFRGFTWSPAKDVFDCFRLQLPTRCENTWWKSSISFNQGIVFHLLMQLLWTLMLLLTLICFILLELKLMLFELELDLFCPKNWNCCGEHMNNAADLLNIKCVIFFFLNWKFNTISIVSFKIGLIISLSP